MRRGDNKRRKNGDRGGQVKEEAPGILFGLEEEEESARSPTDTARGEVLLGMVVGKFLYRLTLIE